MQHRITAAALLAACVAAGVVPATGATAPAARAGKSATFSAKNEFKVTVPEGAKSVRAWFAMPQELPEQKIADLKIECSVPHKIVKDDHGNSFVYVEAAAPAAKEIALVESFKITRQEIVGAVDAAKAKPLGADEKAKFAADLAANANVQITRRRSWATSRTR
jgi:hypothetical protein